MFICQPKKWLWGLLPLALLCLCAWHFNSAPLETKLSKAASAQLAASGSDWVTIAMDGRDAKISGEAPDQDAVSEAVKLVAGTYGVRRVDASGVSIAASVVLERPTVKPVAGKVAMPSISGTWPEGKATTLAVKVAGKTYSLERDAALTSDGSGNWTLVLPVALADGEYDVGVEITDGKKAVASDASVRDVVVDTTPPGAPTIATSTGDPAQPAITGTYDKAAAALTVTAAGATYALGKDNALSTDDSGAWTLAVPEKLKPGKYDVTASTVDEYGNASSATKIGFLAVAAPAPAAAPTVVKVDGFGNTPTVTGTWPQEDGNTLRVTLAGKTYKLGADSELSSDSSGNWSLTPSSPLDDGSYDAVATVTNAGGLSSSGRIPDVVTVLMTVPAAPTVAKVDGFGNTPKVTGTWSQADGNGLQVRLAGKTYKLGTDSELSSDASGNWSLTPSSPLKDGTYDVVATVTNAAGLSTKGSASDEVTVLASTPAAPTVVKVDGFGNTPTVTGTWPQAEGNSLQVTLAGKTYKLGNDSELSSDGDGKWSLTPSSPLDDGTYDVAATVTNAAGLASTGNSSGGVTVLASAPDVPTVVKVDGFGNTPTVAGTWPQAEGNSLQVTLAGKTYKLGSDSELSSDGDGKWSLTPSSPLDDGTYDVAATVTNAAGLASTGNSSGGVTVLTSAPDVPTVVKVDGFGNTPTVTGTWPQAEGNSLQVTLAGKTYKLGNDSELSSDGAGKWSLTPSSPLDDGTYDVAVAARNAAGLISSDGSSNEVRVDITPPGAPTVVSMSGRSMRPAITGAWAEGDRKTLTVAVNGSSYDLAKTGPLTSDGKGSWTLQLEQDLPDGTHDVVATAIDAAGNRSTDQSSGEIVVDTIAPAVPAVRKLVTRERRPTVTGTWPSKDAALLSILVGTKTYTLEDSQTLTVDGDNWNLNIEERLDDGTYDIAATATDSVGNISKYIGNGDLVVDATPPNVPTVNAMKSEPGRPLLSGTFPESDASSIAVTFENETFTLGSSSGLSSDGSGNWSVQSGRDYAPGKYDVKVVVTDRVGNTSTDVTINEIELIAPTKPETPLTTTEAAPAEPAKPTTTPEPITGVALDCQNQINDLLTTNTITFRTRSARLADSSSQLIGKLSAILSQCPDAKIEVGGHTDSRGAASFNKGLSERRANAVRDALVANGANAANITAVGYGESQPIANNATKRGQAINRRTAFKVQP